MNQHEIKGFLKTRKCKGIDKIITQLKQDSMIDVINYKGYNTFRLK